MAAQQRTATIETGERARPADTGLEPPVVHPAPAANGQPTEEKLSAEKLMDLFAGDFC